MRHRPEWPTRAQIKGSRTRGGIDKINLIVPVVTAIVIGIYMGATVGDKPGWTVARHSSNGFGARAAALHAGEATRWRLVLDEA